MCFRQKVFGKKRKLIESDHLSSLLQFVRDDLYPNSIFKTPRFLLIRFLLDSFDPIFCL